MRALVLCLLLCGCAGQSRVPCPDEFPHGVVAWQDGITLEAMAATGLDGTELAEKWLARQRRDGNWDTDHKSDNLADGGSLAAGLAVTASVPNEPLARYARRIVLPMQRDDGSFPNGLWYGEHYHRPYTVATANQAHFLRIMYRRTGHRVYLIAFQRAQAWLDANIGDGGSVKFYPHNGPPTLRPPWRHMGDDVYMLRVLGPEALARYLSGKPEDMAPWTVETMDNGPGDWEAAKRMYCVRWGNVPQPELSEFSPPHRIAMAFWCLGRSER